MKEYTITKTLFKMKKKTHTTVRVKRRRELYEGKFGTVFLWGRICEMDLMTFAKRPRTRKQSDGNFPVLSPVV